MRRYGHRSILTGVILPIVVFAAIIGFIFVAVSDASKSADTQQYKQTLGAIQKAVTSCYAIEGRYPPDIDYLKEHYGVSIDDNRYIVSYDIFASNIRPTVQLIVKGSGGDAVD